MSEYWTVWLTFSDGKPTFVRDVNTITFRDGVLYLTDEQRNTVDRHVEVVDRGAFVLANVRSWTKEPRR